MQYASPEKLYVEREKPFIERDSFSNVNQIGYVTIEQQVTSLIIAGERLMSYKRQAYDYPDGELDEATARPDPTLDVGFDPADYSFYSSQLAKRLAKARKEKEAPEKDTSVSASESKEESKEA